MSCTVLAVRADCSLCDDARELLAGLGHDYVEREAGPDDIVPIVVVDGEVVAQGRVSPLRLRLALRRARRNRR